MKSLNGSSVICCSEPELPNELLPYAREEPDQLRVGAAGKTGLLALEFGLDGARRTIIRRQYTQLPFHVSRVLRLDERFPGMAFVYVQMPTGGILQGDRLRIELDIAAGTQVHLTTQSISKVYRMNRNYASQAMNVRVGEGALFEYYPDALLLQKHARYVQENRLTVHDDATAVYGEIFLPGRVASGEVFQYDALYSSLIVENHDGKPRLREAALLEPAKANLKGKGVLGRFNVFGNFYVLTPAPNIDRLSDQIHQLLRADENIAGGSSLLPFRDGIVVRILGEHHRHVKSAMDKVWDDVRRFLFDVPAPYIRK